MNAEIFKIFFSFKFSSVDLVSNPLLCYSSPKLFQLFMSAGSPQLMNSIFGKDHPFGRMGLHLIATAFAYQSQIYLMTTVICFTNIAKNVIKFDPVMWVP